VEGEGRREGRGKELHTFSTVPAETNERGRRRRKDAKGR
jgi:hypothetical protein